MESIAKLQKLNLEMVNLEDEETRVKSIQVKIKKITRNLRL